MTERNGKSGQQPRSERLKAALRENLKRRKAQAKARSQATTASAEQDSAGIRREIQPSKPKG
jgi:hypothetical protein